jgi:hypothetical protein
MESNSFSHCTLGMKAVSSSAVGLDVGKVELGISLGDFCEWSKERRHHSVAVKVIEQTQRSERESSGKNRLQR